MESDGTPSPPPPWASPGCPFQHGGVEFRATLVRPLATARNQKSDIRDFEQPSSGWPLVLFFPGLDVSSSDVVFEWAERFEAITPVPFVLASPERETGTWWFIDDASDWGWINGNFSKTLIEKYSEWVRFMSLYPGIDSSRVSLLGYSGGAYAAAELLASGRFGVPLHGVVVAAVHGHGQSSEASLPKKYADRLNDKFEVFLNRLSNHPGADWIEVVHAENDQWSRIEDAECIIEVLRDRQRQLGRPDITVRYVKEKDMDRRCRSQHFYFEDAFQRRSLWAKLLLPVVQLYPGVLDVASLDERATIADRKTQAMKVLLPLAQPWYSRLFGILRPHAWEIIDWAGLLFLQVSWAGGVGVLRMHLNSITFHANSGTKPGLASQVNRWCPCGESLKLECGESDHQRGPLVWRCQSTQVCDVWSIGDSPSAASVLRPSPATPPPPPQSGPMPQRAALDSQEALATEVLRINNANCHLRDFRTILGFATGESVTLPLATKRWKQLMMLLHPDKRTAAGESRAGGREACEKAMERVTEAKKYAEQILSRCPGGYTYGVAQPPSAATVRPVPSAQPPSAVSRPRQPPPPAAGSSQQVPDHLPQRAPVPPAAPRSSIPAPPPGPPPIQAMRPQAPPPPPAAGSSQQAPDHLPQRAPVPPAAPRSSTPAPPPGPPPIKAMIGPQAPPPPAPPVTAPAAPAPPAPGGVRQARLSPRQLQVAESEEWLRVLEKGRYWYSFNRRTRRISEVDVQAAWSGQWDDASGDWYYWKIDNPGHTVRTLPELDEAQKILQASTEQAMNYSSKAQFDIGERVECRDLGEEWESGTVTSLHPLKVRKDGWDQSFGWEEVRKAESSWSLLAPSILAASPVRRAPCASSVPSQVPAPPPSSRPSSSLTTSVAEYVTHQKVQSHDTASSHVSVGSGKCKGKGKGKGTKGRALTISKGLSTILRHDAQRLGLRIGADGFVSVKELLSVQFLQDLDVTLLELQTIVNNNDKARFEIVHRNGDFEIRAVQGHSMKSVKDENALQKLSATDSDLPAVCVHGTYIRHLGSIKRQGLLPGGLGHSSYRNHVHFIGYEPGDRRVISGMRYDCEVAIYIDLRRALQDGVPFFRSANGVILSGSIAPNYITKVIILSGSIPPNSITKVTMPQRSISLAPPPCASRSSTAQRSKSIEAPRSASASALRTRLANGSASLAPPPPPSTLKSLTAQRLKSSESPPNTSEDSTPIGLSPPLSSNAPDASTATSLAPPLSLNPSGTPEGDSGQDINRMCPKPGCRFVVGSRGSATHCCLRCQLAYELVD